MITRTERANKRKSAHDRQTATTKNTAGTLDIVTSLHYIYVIQSCRNLYRYHRSALYVYLLEGFGVKRNFEGEISFSLHRYVFLVFCAVGVFHDGPRLK